MKDTTRPFMNNYLKLQFTALLLTCAVVVGCATEVLPPQNSAPSAAAQTSPATQILTNLVQSAQPEGHRRVPGYNEKQGYSKEHSAQLLSPEVRALLDAMLRFYTEPGLFTNRTKVMQVLGVNNSRREWDPRQAAEGGYRSYEDFLAVEGLLSVKGWKGFYRYNGKREKWVNEWHSALILDFDSKPEGADCINSRAVEGYFDLVLDPGISGSARTTPGAIWRHEFVLAKPGAKPISNRTPSLGMRFSEGCLISLDVGRIFELKEINDDYARDQ
jgi:hypothetical protein